jgi:diacylglycerol kinase family enzyme
MGNAIRYTTAALLELINGDKTYARVTIEDADGKEIVYEEKFCLIIGNNIVTAAKGMKMAPKAKLNDGLVDLLMVRSQKS